jgi:ERCC4-type nuclease
MGKIIMPKYTVVRDTREQKNFWQFDESPWCNETIEKALPTGDYSLLGMESFFTIERKYSTGEFSANVCEKRFERELVRLDKMDQAYLILEFGWDEIESFPQKSGIPSRFWKNLRVSPKFLRKRLIEIMSDYNIQVILAEDRGAEIAELLFKRMNVLYSE